MDCFNIWQFDKKLICLLQKERKTGNIRIQLRDWRKIDLKIYVGVPTGSVIEIKMPTAWAHAYFSAAQAVLCYYSEQTESLEEAIS